MMWIMNKSWTNLDSDDPTERYTTEMNGYVIFGGLIAYRFFSSLFFYLRAREMESEDVKSRPIRTGLSQLFCLRLYWDVEKACKLRRQTTAIREHKILEGVLNSFIFLLVGMYYYFEKSVGADRIEEASWLIFASVLALISVALVLNMGDVLGISVKKSMRWRDTILIAFRMTDVSLRVGAYAVFAASVSARNTIYICAADLTILCFLSYFNIIIINTNRFEFEKHPGTITKILKTVLSSIYGLIACPLLHKAKYWYPIKVLHDGALIFASWWFRDDNVVLWDEGQTMWVVFVGTTLFFVLGLMSYCVIDWDQYNKIIDVKGEEDAEEDKDLISRIITMCEDEPELLSRFLVSGVVRVSSVKALAVRGWDEYGRTRSWLQENGFYDLVEVEENQLTHRKSSGKNRSPSKSRKSEFTEEKFIGPQDIQFEIDNVVEYSKELVSNTPKAKVLCMSVSLNGHFLAVGLEDEPYLEILKLPSMIKVADLQSSMGKKRFFGAVTGVAFKTLRTGGFQLITISEDARLRIFEVTQGSKNMELRKSAEIVISGKRGELKKSTHKIRCLAMDSTETNVVVGVEENIWCVNIGSGKVHFDSRESKEHELRGHTDEITAIKFFPNESTKFVTGSKDKTVRIWDQREQPGGSFKSILDFGEWSESIDIIRTVDINSNGTAIACGCINGVVIVWEKLRAEEWKVVSRINAANWVNKVNFLPMSENANSLIIHTRPLKTAQNPDDEQQQSNGYSAVVDYKTGQCSSTLVQPNQCKRAVESSCIFEQENKLKLLTGSWTDKDEHLIILWDLDTKIGENLV